MPVPQLSMLRQGSPILELLVGLIQTDSYTDCNYTGMNGTLLVWCDYFIARKVQSIPLGTELTRKIMTERTALVKIKASEFLL